MKIIVGLGNPGREYLNSRHNLGFMVLDRYAKKLGQPANWGLSTKFKSEIIQTEDLLLVKPQTFMNNSGEAVSAVVNFYKIPIEDVIVIHDELDLPLGQVKIKQGGGAAGHHGIESIVEKLGNPEFTRIRIGIDNQSTKYLVPAEDYVLMPFDVSEEQSIKEVLDRAVDMLDCVIKEGLSVAQNKLHQVVDNN